MASERPDPADAPFPPCPSCDGPVTDVAATGPHTHFARPCGCRLTLADVRELRAG